MFKDFLEVFIKKSCISTLWCSLDALSEIQNGFTRMDYFCYGESKRINTATELPGVLETTSSTNPPRPDNLTFYGKVDIEKHGHAVSSFDFNHVAWDSSYHRLTVADDNT